jgi:hypothetical protein
MRARHAIVICAAAACGKNLADLEPFHCAQDGTCPAGYICIENYLCQPAQSCNLVPASNDCLEPTRRCTLVESPGDISQAGVFVSQCVATNNSTLHEGDACSAGTSSALYADPDTCATGSVCYNEGTAFAGQEASPHCRVFCASDADCGGTGHCAQAFAGPLFSAVSTVGVCENRCDFGGNPCTAPGQHCDALVGIAGGGAAVLLCRDDGIADVGQPCATVSCKAGLVCIPGIAPFQTGPVCRVPCNDTNMLCAVGTCETSAYDMGGGWGFCH